MRGLVFNIEEFAVYDGPGIRTVVFLKGCPLRCRWCHNPEGLSLLPQRMVQRERCLHCGACAAVCKTPGACTACGACVRACPQELIRIAGQWWEAEALAATLQRSAPFLRDAGGGVTFSGGEALLQTPFLLEVIGHLDTLHCAVETCGHVREDWFAKAVEALDLILMDVKLADPEKHKQYTGVDNGLILKNLAYLKQSGKPFIARLPLIPGVNTEGENLLATARLLEGSRGLQRVELLPYNRAAGAKYSQVGLPFSPDWDEDGQTRVDIRPFTDRGMEVKLL